MAKSLGQLCEECAYLQEALTAWGLTATAAELNILGSTTANATDMVKLAAINRTATALNYVLTHGSSDLCVWSGSTACTAKASVSPSGVTTIYHVLAGKISAGTTTHKAGLHISAKKASATRAVFYRWRLPSTAAATAGTINYLIIGKKA